MLLSMVINSKQKNLNEIVKMFNLLKTGVLSFPNDVWCALKTNSKTNENMFYEYIIFISNYNMLINNKSETA